MFVRVVNILERNAFEPNVDKSSSWSRVGQGKKPTVNYYLMPSRAPLCHETDERLPQVPSRSSASPAGRNHSIFGGRRQEKSRMDMCSQDRPNGKGCGAPTGTSVCPIFRLRFCCRGSVKFAAKVEVDSKCRSRFGDGRSGGADLTSRSSELAEASTADA